MRPAETCRIFRPQGACRNVVLIEFEMEDKMDPKWKKSPDVPKNIRDLFVPEFDRVSGDGLLVFRCKGNEQFWAWFSASKADELICLGLYALELARISLGVREDIGFMDRLKSRLYREFFNAVVRPEPMKRPSTLDFESVLDENDVDLIGEDGKDQSQWEPPF